MDQFFRELHALEFGKLSPFLTSIEGKTNLPGPRKNGFVVDGTFVIDMIGIREAIAFNNVHVLAREISCPVEPGLPVHSRDLNN